MEKKVRKMLLYVTGILFFVSTGAILPLVMEAYSSGSWPTATATIIKSSVTADAPGASDAKYFLDLEYEYEIHGNQYTSTNYGTQGKLSSRSEWEMIDRKKQFPTGAEITIVYDPDNHSYARIQRGLAWYHTSGIIWIFVSGGLFLATILAKEKAQDTAKAVVVTS